MNTWQGAQDYEFEWGRKWIDDLGPSRESIAEAFKHEFGGPFTDTVLEHVSTRTLLEIGCGPRPLFLPCKHSIVIEPLLDKYRTYIEGRGWFNIDEPYSQPVEQIVEPWCGKVDGMVFCRNVLDHTEDPYKALDAILCYGAVGSYLAFWTDTWHIKGPDEGHRNITQNPLEIEQRIVDTGYEVLRHANIRALDGEFKNQDYIDYGCLARRIHV